MCSSPMKSLKDLKGKRLRTAGAALSRWAESIGAVPVNVPSSEMYQGVFEALGVHLGARGVDLGGLGVDLGGRGR